MQEDKHNPPRPALGAIAVQAPRTRELLPRSPHSSRQNLISIDQGLLQKTGAYTVLLVTMYGTSIVQCILKDISQNVE